jgi:phosphohistidine phosphatase SixA
MSDTLGGTPELVAGLQPSSEVIAAARRLITRSERSVLVVGHLPFMGPARLASPHWRSGRGTLHCLGAVAGLRMTRALDARMVFGTSLS